MNGHFGTPWFSFKVRFSPDAAPAGDTSLNAMIDQAVKQLDKEFGPADKDESSSEEPTEEKEDLEEEPETEENEENEEEENKESEENEESSEEEDLTPEQILHAKNLFKGLNNPAQREAIIRALAGSLVDKVETVKDEKVLADVIEETVKKNLGKYEFLAKGISDSIKEVVELLVDEKTREIKTEIASSKQEKLQNQIDSAIAETFSEYTNVDEKIQKQVLSLMETMKPGEGVTPKAYFKALTITAAAQLDIKLVKKVAKAPNTNSDGTDAITQSRIKKNRNDASSRLASERVSNPKGKAVSTEKMDINDSIRAAMESVDKLK